MQHFLKIEIAGKRYGEARKFKKVRKFASSQVQILKFKSSKFKFNWNPYLQPRSTWMPEYGAFMVEGCPSKPFEGIQALAQVEERMRARRSRLMAVLGPHEVAESGRRPSAAAS